MGRVKGSQPRNASEQPRRTERFEGLRGRRRGAARSRAQRPAGCELATVGRFLLLTCLALAASGCVERQLVVETVPAGAEVFIDGREAGRTGEGVPLTIRFESYGTRTLVARKRGHVPLTREVTLDPPWWQWPVIDVFTDLLWPGTITDVHLVRLELEPRPAPEDPQALEDRARHAAEHEGKRP